MTESLKKLIERVRNAEDISDSFLCESIEARTVKSEELYWLTCRLLQVLEELERGELEIADALETALDRLEADYV